MGRCLSGAFGNVGQWLVDQLIVTMPLENTFQAARLQVGQR
ncbi:MAG: hypothetical protein PVH19_05710 [Planctomycetia bacterium]